jgi:transaldolase
MAIYIDSAVLEDVKSAQAFGWVRGVTTNPILLAKAGGDPRDVLSALARLKFKQLFYQLVSPTLDGMYAEVQTVSAMAGSTLVLKLPPTQTGFQFVSRFGNQFPCCVTAVYSPAQALVAREAGARYVAVYVNRATRLLGDGMRLVQEVAGMLSGSRTELIAASIKSTQEACLSMQAGAHHLTLPYDVLAGLMSHPLSEATLDEFKANGFGIQHLEKASPV